MRSCSFVLFALLGGCSSSSEGSSTPTDSGSYDTLVAEETVNDSAPASETSSDDTKTASDAAPKNCPGCQVKSCMPELTSCGGNSTCLEWLKCWNDCYKTSDPVPCQDTCMTDTPTPEGKKLEACSKTKCAADCLP